MGIKIHKIVNDAGEKLADIVVFENGSCAMYAHIAGHNDHSGIYGAQLHSSVDSAADWMSECLGPKTHFNVIFAGDRDTLLEDKIVAQTFALIESYKALRHAIEAYGKPGGPWNIPSCPGSWIANAKSAVQAIKDALVDKP